MIPLPYKILFIAAGAILAGAGGYIAGYSKATDKYAPQIAQLEAAINLANQEVEREQNERANALAENRKVADDLYSRVDADRTDRIARVRDLTARNKGLAAAVAGSTEGDFREPSQSGIAQEFGNCEVKRIELEGRCITDAAARVVIKDWAERIGLKPAK